MNDRFLKIFQKFKNGKTLFIIGLAGILLIFASSFFSKPVAESSSKTYEEVELEEYKAQLEKKIKKIVKEITGNKQAEVLITLDGGIRRTFAENASQRESEGESESEKQYITVTDANGNETALTVYEQYPEIRGVTVVYTGSSASGEKIKNAVMAALGITSKRIYTVAKGGN